MTSFGLDVACARADNSADPAALPDPRVCPTDQSNA
jgi:hypothetical protein